MAKSSQKGASGFNRIKDAAAGVVLPNSELVIPAVIPQEPREVWQVVVVGTIDPRQHHPAWYRMIECISEEELTGATSSFVSIILPVAANQPFLTSKCEFDVGAFAIHVVPDKWIIQTVLENNCQRILDVAGVVFAKLNELQITAYGVNKTMALKLEKITSKQFLADKLSGVDLALKAGDASAHITHTRHLGDSDTMIQLGLSPLGEKWLSVLHNRHHPIPKPTAKPKEGWSAVYFDLGKLLKENAEADWRSASQFASDLVECIARAEEVDHGH